MTAFYPAEMRELSQCTRQITVQCRNNYGATVIYPICSEAKIFAAMLGQKTLTHSDIQHILRLGYEIFDQPVEPTTFKL